MPNDGQPTPQPTPASGFQALLEKHQNDSIRLASTLFDENFQLRERNRELKSQIPADGSMVLSAEDAKKYKAIVDLGVEPKDIKAALEKLPVLEKENKELAGMETLREIADIGLDGSKLKLSVLKDQLQKYPDAVVSFKTEKDKSGNEVKVAFIKTTNDAAEVPFTQFASESLADYLPALKVNAEAAPAIPGNAHDPKPNGNAGGSIFDRIRSAVKTETETKPKVDLDARFGRPANV